MAQTTGTYSTYDIVGQREELADTISMITPEETPLYTSLKKQKLASKHPEWQTDVLEPPADNAQLEGDNYSFSSKTPTTRVGNYTQILHKTGIISGTAEVVDKAGRSKESTREKMKSGLALRKDLERMLLSNQASVAGDDITARRSAGIPAWLTSNDDRDVGGSEGGFSGGLVAAATNGSQRAFTKTITDTVMALTYNSGGNARHVYVSPYVKSVQSRFMSDSNVVALRSAAEDSPRNMLIAAADIYLSDFGKVTFHPNRVMATSAALARNAFFIDPDMIAYGTLRPIQEDDVAKTGDHVPYVLIHEGCLIMRNQAAHGIAADLYGLTAST